MKGLCHFCLTSNIEVFINKGQIRCSKCRLAVKQPKHKDNKPLLKFEDVPIPTEEQRRQVTEKLAKESYERLLKRYPKT